MITELQACKSRICLANLIDIEPKELSFVLYKMPESVRYSSFCISKKNGSQRNISAPHPRLKWIQKRLLETLYECEKDIAVKQGKTPSLDYGFRPGTNIYDNARVHRNQKFVLNVDIDSYFDQFNFGRVRGFFSKNNDFSLHLDVATIIAQIVCFKNTLPQGAPTSPHIANLLSRFFDRRMAKFLRPYRCAYSRYADDITISTNMKDFPPQVALPDESVPQGWRLSPKIADLFARASLPINSSKTRMSIRGSRQMVTGLVVNQRPNVTREYYLTTRAACHSLFRTGSIIIPYFTDGFGENCEPNGNAKKKLDQKDPLAVLEGRLTHIHHIREKTDLREISEKQDSPTQFWKLLQLFYIYKYFVGNKSATILTEGPSDIYYLKSAIASIDSKKIPYLKSDNTERKIIPGFFRFDSLASKVLGLGGGSGNIKRFLYLYNKARKNFDQNLRTQPVIIFIDNDSGGKDVISQINGMFKKKIKIDDSETIHVVTNGLILVKTPHIGKNQITCIEDFLPDTVKNITINGKTFSPEKKIDPSKNFGKIVLANFVKSNANEKMFSEFSIILKSINEAVKNFYI